MFNTLNMTHRPRTSPEDNLLWRLFCSIPILGSAVWCSNERHSLSPAGSLAGGVSPRYFRSPSSGLFVHYRTWSPSVKPRGVVYILHGIFEHIERYSHVAEFWARKGFVVHGLDHQGHGASEGDAGYFYSFAAMVSDALHLAREVVPSSEGLPRFLFGG